VLLLAYNHVVAVVMSIIVQCFFGMVLFIEQH